MSPLRRGFRQSPLHYAARNATTLKGISNLRIRHPFVPALVLHPAMATEQERAVDRANSDGKHSL